ncbi:armadillo repeat-containing protein 3 isoform X1 [Chiloscyllium plagiosum]|uniref:armadillo repeat-containing protein 3 isoform X1 n=1 Tax=Chiloscyllium plagiosum TaxID=36176 RepID=UPI001CB7F30F|nr:armadillo repeat-containing protein 3 isoform X1 [Chiloscyllium plagiosum]XP_043546377.1 armadillo repeat-containing protein 3 isoform X1 [Chiloscyllium plagiosum]XP_043546378.1 armadillo repeat-containing protein 3 isoform X1 [Chiloscyllium plagiosum]XP_043546379.1 armadillo repeat-containing protein 3 isoform X1 [Chiloscyllium plagiosum]XP_043546380.1 armadillo repeat-containing protein 3 isoform X1 [Chiloscyllium plagiosum]
MGKKQKKEVEASPKDAFNSLIIESKNVQTVVLMLDSPEDEILLKACEAIYKFAEKGDENKMALLALGAVPKLAKLISHDDKQIHMYATMGFGVMATNSEVRKSMRQLDFLPSIIACLAPDDDVVVHELATLCLSSMSIDFTSKVEIYEKGGLGPLIQLLSSPDPDVQKNSIECISNLVKDYVCRVALNKMNGIFPVLNLLSSEYPVIQQLALQTLITTSNDAVSRKTLFQNEGHESLLQVLDSPELSDLHADALHVLANCLEEAQNVTIIRESGALEKFLLFVATSSFPEAQRHATNAITRSARNSETRNIFHQEGLEKALVILLGINNDAVKIAACEAVSVMCSSESSKETFRTEEAIVQIVPLLTSDNVEMREAAALALANLTTANSSNASAVFDAEGVEPLVKLLTEPVDGIVVNAAATITNLALQEPIRASIQNCGAMTAIVEPLKSTNTLVQSKAALLVASLACDVNGRTELRNVGGLEPLVELLHSNNDEVRRNACWAVLVCGKDEPTTAELCKLGALEILQEVNQSSSRKNNFSDAAVKRLLDHNAALKYSLTGYLSFNDIITDGFYDPGWAPHTTPHYYPGTCNNHSCACSIHVSEMTTTSKSQIKPGMKVLPLEELSNQEVNQHRPILLINAKRADGHQMAGLSAEEKLTETPSAASNRFPSSKAYSKDKPSSKGRSRGKKEEEKVKEEQPQSKIEEEERNKPWECPYDVLFDAYLSEITRNILPLLSIREQIVALATFVSEKMGGPIHKEKLHEFNWELHIADLKFELKSNIIPIGKIQKGVYYHRALLFKALADRIGISCSLVRGEYNRAWNEVMLVDQPTQDVIGLFIPPTKYIVDLMHQVGNLMRTDSPDAAHYESYSSCKHTTCKCCKQLSWYLDHFENK